MSGTKTLYAVVGGTLWGNRGAEAMVATTIGQVRERYPDARFLLMTYLPKADREILSDSDVAIVDTSPRRALMLHIPFAILCWIASRIGFRIPGIYLPASVRNLRRCRALLDVSGIAFHDERLTVVAYNIVCLWPALLVGVPVIRLSQALGPFKNPLNRLPARWLTKASSHTYARGESTADYLRGLNVSPDSWSVAADVAFLYKEAYSLTIETGPQVEQAKAAIRESSDSGRRTVAVVPSSLVFEKMSKDGRDYLDVLLEVINYLEARGRSVIVIPNATRQRSEGLRNNDIAVIRHLQDRISDHRPLGANDVTFVDFDINTAGIRYLLTDCEIVITSRFHAMVAALALGIPPLAMGWSHKYAEVLQMFDLLDSGVDATEPPDRLFLVLDRLLDGNAEVRERIRNRLPDVQDSARQQFDILDKIARTVQ